MNKTLKTLTLLGLTCLNATAQTITGNYDIPQVPEWAKNAVFYQIYPQTFCDSPFNDAGYDIRDYYKIAPRYGTNEDARQLPTLSSNYCNKHPYEETDI